MGSPCSVGCQALAIPSSRCFMARCCSPVQVLDKLQRPPLHNSILSQQGRQAEDHEWKVGLPCMKCACVQCTPHSAHSIAAAPTSYPRTPANRVRTSCGVLCRCWSFARRMTASGGSPRCSRSRRRPSRWASRRGTSASLLRTTGQARSGAHFVSHWSRCTVLAAAGLQPELSSCSCREVVVVVA